MEYQRYVKHTLTPREADELELVDERASSLRSYLESRAEALRVGHVHGARSSVIQDLVAAHLVELRGFDSESVILAGDTVQLRPRADFYGALGDGRGIVVEVERGGTTTNNHDLKDVWKTHLADNAHHLFLVVPRVNFKADGSPRERPYDAVVRRLKPFFANPAKSIDVVSAHIFGY